MSVTVSRSRSRSLAIAVIVGACAVILGWSVAAIAMADRGLDPTDEGFLLLSYRWWDSTPRSFTGVQYFYGPAFAVLGHSVPALRMLRLGTVLAAHAAFAWSFVTWLAARRPGAVPDRLWAWAGGLVITASGGVVYGWMPLSPGYNDVSVLGSMLLVAVLLRSLRAVALGDRLPVTPALATGPIVLALVLAKWSAAAVVLLFLFGVFLAAWRSAGARGQRRFVAMAIFSIGLAALAFDLLVAPFGRFLPETLAVNRLVAARTNSPLSLIHLYAETGAAVVRTALFLCLPAAIFAAVGATTMRRGRRRTGATLLVLAPVAGVVSSDPADLGLPGGGVGRVTSYTIVLVALFLTAVGAVLVDRARLVRTGPGLPGTAVERLVLLCLLVLPGVQALGTGNPLYTLAVNQFACWVAVLVWWIATSEQEWGRVLIASVVACSIVVVAQVSVTGLLVRPFRTSGYADATVRIGGPGVTSGLRVSREEERLYAAVREAVPTFASGSPMMAFDEMAGVPLSMDARSVGEAWYSALDPSRTAAGIDDACRHGAPWGDRPPVLVFSREPVASDRAALAGCGLNLDSDYRRTGVVDTGILRLRFYLPVDKDEP